MKAIFFFREELAYVVFPDIWFVAVFHEFGCWITGPIWSVWRRCC